MIRKTVRSKVFKPKRIEGKTFNGRMDNDRLYGKEWERYRSKFLSLNRTCYACGAKATVVDHIVPHKGDILLFEKLTNHLPLCKHCHDKVTALFDKGFVVGGSNEKKLIWLADQRARKEIYSRVRVLSSYP